MPENQSAAQAVPDEADRAAVLEARAAVSLARLRAIGPGLALAAAAFGVFLVLTASTAGARSTWHTRAGSINLVLGTLLAAACAAAWSGRRDPAVAAGWRRIVPAITATSMLVIAAWHAASDLEVSSSLLPWIIACLGVAVVLRLSFREAAAAYLAGTLALVAGIRHFQADPSVVLHTVLNGAFLAALFTGLASSLTAAHDRQVIAARTIARQRAELHELRGFLRVCACCGKVRNEVDEWEPLPRYLGRHSQAVFSHGLCAPCLEERYPEPAATPVPGAPPGGQEPVR